MKNYISPQMLRNYRTLLDSKLFTKIQFDVLAKRVKELPLNSTEKTYYYKFIKPKIAAMRTFLDIDDVQITGKEFIIPERIPKAITQLHTLERKHKNKKILISGSFLFSKRYDDIDVFVFTKYNKTEYRKGLLHVTFLPDSALESLFFSSLAKISISNFTFLHKTEFKIDFKEVLQNYELLINSILQHENKRQILRDFILTLEYISRGSVLNSKQLYNLVNKLEKKKIKILSTVFINALILGYDQKVLTHYLKKQVHTYKKLANEYDDASNIPIYIDSTTR